MKKPEVKVIRFTQEDVITTSGPSSHTILPGFNSTALRYRGASGGYKMEIHSGDSKERAVYIYDPDGNISGSWFVNGSYYHCHYTSTTASYQLCNDESHWYIYQ